MLLSGPGQCLDAWLVRLGGSGYPGPRRAMPSGAGASVDAAAALEGSADMRMLGQLSQFQASSGGGRLLRPSSGGGGEVLLGVRVRRARLRQTEDSRDRSLP